MNSTEELSVSLRTPDGDVPVGVLERNTAGLIRFTFERSYIDLGPDRPILSSSQAYPGDEERTILQLRNGPMTGQGQEVHPWFSNLLPEGALRDMVERGLPSGMTSDFDVLAHLGDDLPGAVVVRPMESYRATPGKPKANQDEVRQPGVRIRFSLAGIQLKMSMYKQDERLTFPAMGADGDIIAKLPSERYPLLPEIEFASMKLAEAVGIDAAPCSLVPVSSVGGLDEKILRAGESVLAVERFDRRPGGGRIHIEDFAQIMGVHGDRKYSAANEETVLNIATRLGGGGTKPFLEGARRIACNILLGNTDAHLKNWSLWYPDLTTGQLSPAYDIVSVWSYDRSESMALKFRNTRNAEIIDLARFIRAGELCGVPEKAVRKTVIQTIERAADEWPALIRDLPMPEDKADALLERAERLALTREVGARFSTQPTFSPR